MGPSFTDRIHYARLATLPTGTIAYYKVREKSLRHFNISTSFAYTPMAYRRPFLPRMFGARTTFPSYKILYLALAHSLIEQPHAFVVASLFHIDGVKLIHHLGLSLLGRTGSLVSVVSTGLALLQSIRHVSAMDISKIVPQIPLRIERHRYHGLLSLTENRGIIKREIGYRRPREPYLR